MQSARDVYDVIVVGAGIEGSATAYYLAKQGKFVLLLEQFPLPHSRGSSHGQSRITRKAYGPDDFYTEMMEESYSMVEQLQAECEEELFVNCGCLVVGPKDQSFVSGTTDSLKRHAIPHESFGLEGAKKKYPFVRYPDNYQFVLDKTGGILRADKMLRAFQNQFVQHGGYLHDGEPVTHITPGNVVAVKTTKATYQCRSLVLTVGPWAGKMLAKLGVQAPLQPVRVFVCYWKESMPGVFSSGRFPTIVDNVENFYFLPADEYPNMAKVCFHGGPEIDPDQRDKADNSWVMKRAQSYVSKYFPTLAPTPSIVETCIYTNTPDTRFILDRHPTNKNIIIGAGFSEPGLDYCEKRSPMSGFCIVIAFYSPTRVTSLETGETTKLPLIEPGHGFKLSPVIGKVLSQMALGEKTSYDMGPFRLDRFRKSKM